MWCHNNLEKGKDWSKRGGGRFDVIKPIIYPDWGVRLYKSIGIGKIRTGESDNRGRGGARLHGVGGKIVAMGIRGCQRKQLWKKKTIWGS